MNAETWQALALRQQAYRRLLAERMSRWAGNVDGWSADPTALCALATLADRADRHDARMLRHLGKVLTVADLFDGRQPS